MAARLTDEQKKKIIADYVERGSYNATAKMNGVTHQTVKRVVNESTEITKKVQQKKEQNTLDMLAYMDSRKEQAQSVIDDYLRALADPTKIETAKLSEIATTLGIVVDKFMKNAPAGPGGMSEVIKNMETLAERIRQPVPNRDIEDYE